jgi:hypothetical protein
MQKLTIEPFVGHTIYGGKQLWQSKNWHLSQMQEPAY